eukprot:gnl/MRDRNA2_/MRDRNA2_92058_c0_seq1.p1 gnl/MRDRNA2_/MRDRNA2_92058_c0~~gnl/MRDRNA2_/MRDRNA2_92058_c0_seq1.p1  ORF type:complete len:412 (+),score=87.55 gnl/MRDRNA2_/MRDRNA2_92058_c0_seq1:107-1342(+)
MPGKHNGRRRAKGEGDDLPTPRSNTFNTRLNNSIQRILKRNLLRGEIVYTTQDVEGGIQATVATPEMSDTYGSKTFSGEVCHDPHSARESAAEIALQDVLADPELLEIHDAPRPEREPGDKPPDDAPRHKSRLRNTVLKICRISLKKEDIVWETVPSAEGFISTVTCPCLPGTMGEMSWAGDTCEDENLAEQSAALVACEAIMDDEEMLELYNKPKEVDPRDERRQRDREKGKGKGGKGKGKIDQYFDWTSIDPMTMMFCFQNGVNPIHLMESKGWGKGFGKSMDGPAWKRQRTDDGHGGGRRGGDNNTELNNVCQKVIHRGLKKGEIVYDCSAVEGGYQSKVTCNCLPDKWSVTVFAGEVCDYEKAANESAAAIAVQAILGDPELKASYDIPKPERPEKPKELEDGVAAE